jgi:phenylalanyl-tRNA synthetase beta chain
MRFSVRWLKQYLNVDLSVNKIVDALMQAGLEVEEVIDLGMISGKLVVGEILKIEPIEGADKIRLCTVQADDPEPLKIVCGAWNFEVGNKVPVSRFGFKFPDGFVLKPRKIRGIEGQGMLCSPKELGLSDDGAGIWILDDDMVVGEVLDALVEIAITPNRPDALSIIGVARDLAAKIVSAGEVSGKVELKIPDLNMPENEVRTESVAKVTVESKKDCPRYTARMVKGVKIGPSPLWMQYVLVAAGLRPINNIVDITNFVLLEFGHPLHAFDFEKLSGHQIIVRNAVEGEVITTLDEAEQKLTTEDLLICDGKKPVALAGIMGGGNSEISDQTENVLIESAYFHPPTIRKTSKRLDKSTDSSYRFERGTDAKKVSAALNRCAQLVAELAGGEVLRGIIDVVGELPKVDPILVKIARINRVLGMALTGRDITAVLTPLGFEILRSDREEMLIAVPSHRVDVSIEADLVEEVARVIGYDKIAEKSLALPSIYAPQKPLDVIRTNLADIAVDLGFCQALNFSFIGEEGNALIGADDNCQIRVINPVLADQGVMRRSLLPSLLQNVAHNLNQSVEEVALFELGHSYQFETPEPVERDEKEETPPAIETPIFAAILAGGGKPNWREGVAEFDFYDMKGYTEAFLSAVGIQKFVIEPVNDVPWLHPGRSARFLVKGQPVALFGEVHPALLKEQGIKKRVCYVEMPLTQNLLDASAVPVYKEIPRYPAMTRDIALVVDKAVRSMDLERTIKKAGQGLLASVRLFDVYEGKHMEEGKKSLAFSLTYRAQDRTLKEDEVTEKHGAVLAALEQQNGAKLRS